MKIGTKEKLVDKIEEDYRWREREIRELRDLIELQSISSIKERVLCRSGVALLYAHWEGFIKKSGTYFLEYVASQRLTIEELESNFVTIVLKNRLDEASKSKRYSAFGEITAYLLQNRKTKARLPSKGIVDTQSNLSSTALKEIAWFLGLEYKHFELKEKLIDQSLVGKRNHVAHGEYLDVDREEFITLSDDVMGLMKTFGNLIENSVAQEQYKCNR